MAEKQRIKTIEKVMPSVVSVVVSKHLEELKADLSKMADVKPKISVDDIPQENIDSEGNVEVGGGSGFMVDSSGIVLTNRHVIAEPNTTYKVVLSNGREFDAKVMARDPLDDIAILKIESEDSLPAVTLGDSDELELGRSVLAFGNVMGRFQNTVSAGIISGLSRSIRAQITPKSPSIEMRGLIQTDAAINPGNSGGPLTGVNGEVIGINVAVASGVQNVGFAIPIKLVERDLRDLKEYGTIKRPFLGVRYITVDQKFAEKLDLPVSHGALVTPGEDKKPVVEGSPADEVGLEEGDVILAWNGDYVTPENNIRDYLAESGVGDTVNLTVLRDNKETEIEVELSERK